MLGVGEVGIQEREWRPPWAVDIGLVLGPHRRGTGDPAFAVDTGGGYWRAVRTPDGPGTLRVRRCSDVVQAAAWGPGAAWLLDAVPEMLGAADDLSGFEPKHDVLREAVRRHPGLRVCRTNRVFEALVPAVLEQKVLSTEAWRAWRYLLRRFGEPAPVPRGVVTDRGHALDLRVPPPPETWARIPSWEWHRSGIEAVRARTIIGAARVASRLENGGGRVDDPGGPADNDPGGPVDNAAESRLRSLPGVGVWTAAETRQRAVGDPDAVSVGDYHLPGLVGWALTGSKTDDDGMLELLEPYRGHRHRVTRLLGLTGARPPRRGPRLPVRDYRSF
ncbi:DNA-3-methyladenine glycosylase family protein [Actinomadura oligospora]|uniref:DNA-3-methyladenine glycosylase family protein n=1 Tax=Actinomadura oligospora TaxID=111804 RepID=UPI001FE16339|nr:DNA-3-methyladenine glycosylase 2 family protein [Actinomadura oligospora]